MKSFKTYITEAQKIEANRGDLAEVLLGAAVTAKFWKHPAKGMVTIDDIKEVLRMVLKSNPIELKRGDIGYESKISDIIRFKMGVPKKAHDFIQIESNWNYIKDLFNSVVHHVNSDRRLDLQSTVLSKNGKINDIYINSDGTGDQKGTKADIKIEVDGKKTNNQISLKVSGGEQFDQVAGVTFDKQLTIWNRLGVDVSKIKKEYDEISDRIDQTIKFSSREIANSSEFVKMTREAASIPYKYAASELSAGLKAQDHTLINALAEFIKTGATRNDPTIEMVKLESGKSKKARFGPNFIKNLHDIAPDLKVSYKMTSDPIVVIYDSKLGSGKEGKLLQIRGKYTAESSGKGANKRYKIYYRNIVETGDLFFKLATDK